MKKFAKRIYGEKTASHLALGEENETEIKIIIPIQRLRYFTRYFTG